MNGEQFLAEIDAEDYAKSATLQPGEQIPLPSRYHNTLADDFEAVKRVACEIERLNEQTPAAIDVGKKSRKLANDVWMAIFSTDRNAYDIKVRRGLMLEVSHILSEVAEFFDPQPDNDHE